MKKPFDPPTSPLPGPGHLFRGEVVYLFSGLCVFQCIYHQVSLLKRVYSSVGRGREKKNSWSVKLEASSQQVTCWRMNKCPLIYREGFSDDVMDTFRVFFCESEKKMEKR